MEIINENIQRYENFVTFSENYYNIWAGVCDELINKHKCINNKKYHLCVFMNLKNGKIITGENSFDYSKHISTHAEIDAMLRTARQDSLETARQRPRYDILVIRLTKLGKLGNSRPCYHCIKSLQQSNIKIRNVYYSTNQGKIVKEKLSEMDDKNFVHITSGWIYRLGGCTNKQEIVINNNKKILDIYNSYLK